MGIPGELPMELVPGIDNRKPWHQWLSFDDRAPWTGGTGDCHCGKMDYMCHRGRDHPAQAVDAYCRCIQGQSGYVCLCQWRIKSHHTHTGKNVNRIPERKPGV